jgi:hypothetical protein
MLLITCQRSRGLTMKEITDFVVIIQPTSRQEHERWSAKTQIK